MSNPEDGKDNPDLLPTRLQALLRKYFKPPSQLLEELDLIAGKCAGGLCSKKNPCSNCAALDEFVRIHYARQEQLAHVFLVVQWLFRVYRSEMKELLAEAFCEMMQAYEES